MFQPIGKERHGEFTKDGEGIWRYKGRICVLDVESLRQELLLEAHRSRFSIHLGSMKMYHDLKKMFWWLGMKGDVATFVSKCLTCQKVGIRCSLGDRGLLNQVRSLPAYSSELLFGGIGEVVHQRDCKVVRNTIEHNVGPWSPIHIKVLGSIPKSFRYETMSQHCVSSIDGWAVGKDYSNIERYTKGVCLGSTEKLGPLHAIGGICVQQHLSCELWDGSYTSDADHVLEPESAELKENMTFPVTPMRIDDTSVKMLHGKEVLLVKVAWRRAGVEEHTWKLESDM
ncbi:uncharacterized protein [Arachis hypogaea]|uniref:uncharacterized protein n=1 Tax=Arachis hypogaea TaxID=3818 RepID=UPI003B2272A6